MAVGEVIWQYIALKTISYGYSYNRLVGIMPMPQRRWFFSMHPFDMAKPFIIASFSFPTLM